MHQNSLFRRENLKNLLGRGTPPPHTSPPSAPTAPRTLGAFGASTSQPAHFLHPSAAYVVLYSMALSAVLHEWWSDHYDYVCFFVGICCIEWFLNVLYRQSLISILKHFSLIQLLFTADWFAASIAEITTLSLQKCGYWCKLLYSWIFFRRCFLANH